MKQKEFDLNFKDIIIDSLTKAKNTQDTFEKPFYTNDYPDLNDGYSNDFPNLNGDFLDALNEALFTDENKGIFISKDIIEEIVEDNTLNIDGDGFPYLNHSIKIKDIDLSIDIVVYHHNQWDFYFK